MAESMDEPLPGSWWRHRKGGRYEVLGVAQVEADLSRVVVYRSAAGSMWTRPLAEFMDGRFTRDMTDGAHKTTETLRWVWHDKTFASLMLGRVQLAQVSGSPNCWSYTLFFTKPGERPSYSAPTCVEAMREALTHAEKVLADGQ